MNIKVLHTKVQDFIFSYKDDTSKLAFSGSPFEGVTVQELIQQIESRRKVEKKLPTWFNLNTTYYPPKLNLEQASSEVTAKYKSSLFNGTKMADITGGFGVDSFYFSENFESVHHFELNDTLSEITKHNFEYFGKQNILCFAEDGMKQLTKSNYDLIYVDPSRRHNTKGKVFFLRDCEPNIPENLSVLLNHCDTLLLKTSPMLDISAGLNELEFVTQIHIVAVNNEVKELLWFLRKGFLGIPEIKTINICKNSTEAFNFVSNRKFQVEYSPPEAFLYEPNAAIMKSGAFDLVSEEYKIKKLHKNTQLYTSLELTDFPGRRFSIIQVIPYTRTSVLANLKVKKANITIRNFPEDVVTLRKKWKIKDGGEQYLFFATLETNKKVILVCTKVE